MVNAADALWDARNHRSRRRRETRGVAVPIQNTTPFPLRICTDFKTLAMACVRITITTMQGPISVQDLAPGWKTKKPPSPTGSAAMPQHATATAMHFPNLAGLIFLTEKNHLPPQTRLSPFVVWKKIRLSHQPDGLLGTVASGV